MNIKHRFRPLAARAGLALALVAILVAWVGILPVAAQGTVYVVRVGDTLTKIAARHGLTASQLAAANGQTFLIVGRMAACRLQCRVGRHWSVPLIAN